MTKKQIEVEGRELTISDAPLSLVTCDEFSDYSDDPLINVILRFSIRFELRLRHHQRMVTSFDDVKLVHGRHRATHVGQNLERAE